MLTAVNFGVWIPARQVQGSPVPGGMELPALFLPKLAALSGWRDIGLRNGGIVDAPGCKPRSKGTPARRESGKGVALSTRLALGGACLTAVMEAEREGVSRLCRAKA